MGKTSKQHHLMSHDWWGHRNRLFGLQRGGTSLIPYWGKKLWSDTSDEDIKRDRKERDAGRE